MTSKTKAALKRLLPCDAKRGDFAACVRESYISVIGGKGYYKTDITVGRIVSVTRDRKTKRVAPFATGCDLHPRDWDYVAIIPQEKIRDAAAIEALCRKRQDLSRENWNPFKSIEEMREAILPYADV